MNLSRAGQRSKPGRFAPLFFGAVITAGLGTMVVAAQPVEERPPLQLTVDTQPLDRTAADRVSYAPVIQKTAASVVQVYSSKPVRREDATSLAENPMLRHFFGIPHGPPERVRQGLGSGVAVTRDGYILTSYHIVDGADEVKVSVNEADDRVAAKVIGIDPLADIAVLKIEATNLTPATFGDSDQLQVGDVVLAIGNPFAVGQSVSRGIVSAVGRGNLGIEEIEDFIQTDAAINQGNSGGALVDSLGRLIGINTAIVTGNGGSAGVGFAIPINLVRSIAEQIVAKGRVDRGYLGVVPQALTAELAAEFRAPRGALVAEIAEASPAEEAGLQAGDVITKLNDTEVRDPRLFLLAISKLAPDSPARIEYVRDGAKRCAEATLTRRLAETPAKAAHSPEAQEVSAERDGVLEGIGVTNLSQPLREHLGVPERVEGAVVMDVDPGCKSARQGLRHGDVITEVDRKPVKSAEEAIKLSDDFKGSRVIVRVWRQGQSRFLVVGDAAK